MKQLARALQTMLVLVLGMNPIRAEAGTPGSTSRGTVSISVTIPPHVAVRGPSTERGAGPRGGNICVAATGLSSYHVALMPAARGSPANDFRPTLPGGLPDEQQSCGRDLGPGVAVHFDKQKMQAIVGSAGPATLLIVPD